MIILSLQAPTDSIYNLKILLFSDYDKLAKAHSKLQKELDSNYQEKLFLQAEVERLNQEADLREITLRGEEDR